VSKYKLAIPSFVIQYLGYDRTFEEFGSTRGPRIEKTLFDIRDEIQAIAQSRGYNLGAQIDEARDAVTRISLAN
jgi:hypothetical protein